MSVISLKQIWLQESTRHNYVVKEPVIATKRRRNILSKLSRGFEVREVTSIQDKIMESFHIIITDADYSSLALKNKNVLSGFGFFVNIKVITSLNKEYQGHGLGVFNIC